MVDQLFSDLYAEATKCYFHVVQGPRIKCWQKATTELIFC